MMSTPWEKTTVTGDLTFYAEWITLIDLVEVTFDIPQEGQTVWKSPVPVAPEYANYYIERVKLYDENYNEVTEVMPSGEVSLNFNVVPSVEAKFVLKGNSFGDYDYAGKVKVNGKKADFYYQSDSNYLSVEYKFKPKAAPTMGEDGTAIGKGASASIAREYLTNWLSDKDPKGSEFAPLKLKSSKQTKNSITLNWTKSKKATKYVVYGNLSGSENKLKKIKNVKGKSTTIKKIGKTLKKGRYYKFMVVALDKNNKVVSTSKMIHVSTKGSAKAANYKGLKIKVKKTDGKYKTVKKITLKKSKSAQIKATVTKASKKVKVKSILKIRYESSNINVAKVTSKGKITAKGKGTCTIYVYTQNGVRKTVKVTVK